MSTMSSLPRDASRLSAGLTGEVVLPGQPGLTESRMEVRSSSSRTCSPCRASTSASRYSATVRSVPENSAANPSG